MIEVTGRRISDGTLEAVQGITFTARPGEIFGLLGPDGVCKFTTIHCICTLHRPPPGSASSPSGSPFSKTSPPVNSPSMNHHKPKR